MEAVVTLKSGVVIIMTNVKMYYVPRAEKLATDRATDVVMTRDIPIDFYHDHHCNDSIIEIRRMVHTPICLAR